MTSSADLTTSSAASGLRQRIGLVAGPLVATLMLVLPPPQGLEMAAWRTAAVGVWMAIWWMCEALPIAATSLLPMVLFPWLGVVEMRAAAAPYANPLIFLFLGGFLIALGLEEAGLHRRLALQVLSAVGNSERRIMLGFMVASAGLSMWISNTATAMMMLPIALSVVRRFDDRPGDQQSRSTSGFGVCLLLSIAYACSLGGIATLVGTPTNALLAGFLLESYGLEISFARWMALALPVTVVGLAIVYFVLTRWLYPLSAARSGGDAFARERRELGPWSPAERRVGLVFVLTAGLWLTRPLLGGLMPGLDDTGIALFGALLLFAWPLDWRRGTTVLDWSATARLPWGVLLLFGGGLSLASTIQSTGLASWIGSGLGLLQSWPVILLSLASVAVVIFLTELTSNTATAAAFLPVLAPIAIGLGHDPLLLLVPATLAASCAFMLPVATPPNAIVYGSGRVTVPQMARAGLWLNLLFVVLLTLVAQFLLPLAMDVQPGQLPPWATP